MKRFLVTLPITGYILVEVEADNERAAIDAALISDELRTDRIEEWEAHEHIVQGNVFYGRKNRVEVEDISDDE